MSNIKAYSYRQQVYVYVICFKVNSLIYLAINCTSEPFLVRNNDMGMFNWTGIDGEDPRPYATAIRLDMLFL